jgi:pyruvate dehydrogenase E2 component (dihydrolipoamide acetyltransferase)
MPWLTENVPLAGRRELSAWRSLALATWRDVSAASVPAVLEIDAEPMLRFLERESARAGVRVTMVHAVGKAAAEILRRLPDVNCLVRLGGLYRRRNADVFFPVALDEAGEDLSGYVVRDADRKALVEIARELAEAARRMRLSGGDPGYSGLRGAGFARRVLARLVLRAGGLVLFTLNRWSPVLGLPRNAFGSVAVTDISKFGADWAYPPLLPFARLPFLLGVGPVVDRPVLAGGTWRVQRTLRLIVVFDHRVIDGVYGGRMARLLRDLFADPERHFGAGTPA